MRIGTRGFWNVWEWMISVLDTAYSAFRFPTPREENARSMREQTFEARARCQRQVLFLCTGNYYRSRFAEMIFNELARKYNLSWQATSRGLAIERGVNNVGPIAPVIITALEARGFPLVGADRMPQSVCDADMESAFLIIALDAAEHRPLVEECFPRWQEHVSYWRISDAHLLSPEAALPRIERHVCALVEWLRTMQ